MCFRMERRMSHNLIIWPESKYKFRCFGFSCCCWCSSRFVSTTYFCWSQITTQLVICVCVCGWFCFHECLHRKTIDSAVIHSSNTAKKTCVTVPTRTLVRLFISFRHSTRCACESHTNFWWVFFSFFSLPLLLSYKSSLISSFDPFETISRWQII